VKYVDEAIVYGMKRANDWKVDELTLSMDRMAVNFGAEILKIVPGVVSTEVDARLSFNVQGTLAKARRLIKMYKEKGIDKKRILIKIAATWEGAVAAGQLQKEGINCNM